jgi:hypothetical protein
MPISLGQAQTALQNWINADTAVSSNQNYTIDGRTVTRTDAEEIRNNINYWSRIEAGLLRQADGGPSISIKLANFNL